MLQQQAVEPWAVTPPSLKGMLDALSQTDSSECPFARNSLTFSCLCADRRILQVPYLPPAIVTQTSEAHSALALVIGIEVDMRMRQQYDDVQEVQQRKSRQALLCSNASPHTSL